MASGIQEKLKYACNCGKMGFVEVANCDNKYPCRECYLKLRKKGGDEFKSSIEAYAPDIQGD